MSMFNSNPKLDPYTNKITLEDIEKAAEEVFGNNSYPRKLADDWWQLSPNCYGNDKAYEDFCKWMNIKTENPNQIKEWKAPSGMKITFDIKPKKRRCKK